MPLLLDTEQILYVFVVNFKVAEVKPEIALEEFLHEMFVAEMGQALLPSV